MFRTRAMMSTIALLSLTACASLGRETTGHESPATTIRVRNDGFPDVNVFAVIGGVVSRLGFVPGNSSATLRVSQSLIAGATALQILVRPIAGSQYLLPSVPLLDGQLVAVTIANQPAFSQIATTPR